MTTITSQQPARPARLLDINELSRQLGLSVTSIYRRRSTGEPLPPAVKLGTRLRWTQESIDEYIRNNTEQPA
jgi:predicted DNA-binding transcriptional regulator AlpA